MTTVHDRQPDVPNDARTEQGDGVVIGRRTLDCIIAEEGALPPARALVLLRPLARDLDRLHARGLIHGAVRPWHVIMTPNNVPVLSPPINWPHDDGAPLAHADASAHADADFRSPQLLAGEEPRPSDDLYALGVIAYALLTGATPFEQSGPDASPIARHLLVPSARQPGLSREVEGVLLAQLSASPAGRFATGLEVVRELERAAACDAADRPSSDVARGASLLGVLPTRRAVPMGPGAGRLTLSVLPDRVHVPRGRARPRHLRRPDYPELSLPGLWVAIIALVLCSVYLLPLYYILLGTR